LRSDAQSLVALAAVQNGGGQRLEKRGEVAGYWAWKTRFMAELSLAPGVGARPLCWRIPERRLGFCPRAGVEGRDAIMLALLPLHLAACAK
jgi:hypothetical protein